MVWPRNPGPEMGRIIAISQTQHYHCDYTDVGNGALRTSSMADTITGSCLFVPISSPVQQFLAWIFGSKTATGCT